MPNGKQHRGSVGALEGLSPYSITDAKEALSKRQVQKRERRIFDILPETVKTFNEITELAKNYSTKKNPVRGGT
jgi:predicted nucleic acid-binding protein